MKKALALLLAVVMLLSLAACEIEQKPANNDVPSTSKPDKNDYDSEDLESILTYIKTARETACADTETETKALIVKLGVSYDTYIESKDDIASFYETMQKRSTSLYETFQSSSVDYFKAVASQGLDDYDAWDDALGDFYDEWDDAMGDFYDAWDESLGDVYDTMDDLITDASNELEYSEYSDAWSAMYKEYSDTWSAMYKLYSDAWSKTYKDYSACWSGFYKGNTDVDAILAEAAKEDDEAETPDDNTQPDDTQGNNPTDSTETSPDSDADSNEIRPEFKEAMDAYEAFYNEYCDILAKYYANPTDMALLTQYTELMTRAIEMDEAFAKWENEDLNTEELKYYLDVNNRVMQKLLDVMG